MALSLIHIFKATGSTGETVTVNAKAVVLTTGGFGANLDMVVKYKPELKGFMTTNAAGAQGQGIELSLIHIFKVSRILILGKTLGKELKQALHPQVVAPARMDGKLLNHETIRTTNRCV